MDRIRLLTLGGLTLRLGGETTTGASTRHHRLALLALLAGAHDRGLSRDKVHAYLWPDGDAAQARHGLNQLLYFERHHLYAGELFLGRKTLRLNPAVIAVDVWEFEDALAVGAHESAVRLYAGPFLDGFYLAGATREFEHWVEDQRDKYRQQCGAAITTLAKAAAAAGDHDEALSWLRRAVELDPFDTTTARHMVEELLAVGDRAAALRHARQHADLLRIDLGLDPDPDLARLIDLVRGSSG
jgi:DNA-binding SARP family transcriptional activator